MVETTNQTKEMLKSEELCGIDHYLIRQQELFHD